MRGGLACRAVRPCGRRPLGSRAPGLPPSAVEKVHRAPSEAKPKAGVHSFCFVLKPSPMDPTPSAAAPAAAGPTRLSVFLGERTHGPMRPEQGSLELSHLGLGKDQELLQNNLSASRASVGFGPAHAPSDCQVSVVRLPPLRCPQQAGTGTGGWTGPLGRRPVLSGFCPLGGRPLPCGSESANAAASRLSPQAPVPSSPSSVSSAPDSLCSVCSLPRQQQFTPPGQHFHLHKNKVDSYFTLYAN